ncbi:MAG: glycosyltransferase family 9 protein [Vicinamibacteria bacterium]
MSGPERLLVVRAGAIGDSLMVTPLLRALRRSFPGSEIDVWCSRPAAPLFELAPGLGRCFSLRFRNLPFALSLEKQTLVRELRKREHAFAVLLERAPRYRRLLERSGIREIRSFRETPFDPKSHAIVNNLRAAGLEGAEWDLDMEVFLTGEDRRRAAELLSGLPGSKVGVHLGYGPRGKKRNQSERLKGWATSSFIELSRELAARGESLVFTGAAEDRRDVNAIVTGLGRPAAARDLSGRTSVRELAAVIEKLDVLVSVDSGPAHLAAAVGTPLLVLWGPAIPEQVRPISSRSPVVVLRRPPPCAPCYETPLMKSCRRNVCMESITPGEVLEEASRLLAAPRNL